MRLFVSPYLLVPKVDACCLFIPSICPGLHKRFANIIINKVAVKGKARGRTVCKQTWTPGHRSLLFDLSIGSKEMMMVMRLLPVRHER